MIDGSYNIRWLEEHFLNQDDYAVSRRRAGDGMAERFAFSPETLIKAYSLGVFPMADSADSREIKFYDPDMQP